MRSDQRAVAVVAKSSVGQRSVSPSASPSDFCADEWQQLCQTSCVFVPPSHSPCQVSLPLSFEQTDHWGQGSFCLSGRWPWHCQSPPAAAQLLATAQHQSQQHQPDGKNSQLAAETRDLWAVSQRLGLLVGEKGLPRHHWLNESLEMPRESQMEPIVQQKEQPRLPKKRELAAGH